MRAPLFLLALAAWTLFAADGVQEGRRGNDHYRAGEYAAGAQSYRAGLNARKQGVPAPVTSALWNNLGLARHRQSGSAKKKAADAFAQALATAPGAESHARAAYNAGNAAADAQKLKAALGFYKKALLADPAHEDARYNYEYVKRRLEKKAKKKQKKPPKQPPNITPSDFAKRLKQRADSLVAQRRYRAAYRLMRGGLQRDSTVRAFRTFIKRTRTVAGINTPADSSTAPRPPTRPPIRPDVSVGT